MKDKIKYLAYSATTAALSAPAIVSAQFEKPGGTGLPESPTATGIIENVFFWILMLVGLLGVFGFAWAGILYLTAGGNDDQIKKAKKAMLNSAIGIVVALAGLVAINAAQNLLGGQTTF